MEIKRYFQIFWRWAWLIVLGALVAGGVAFLISKNTTPVYQATARLLIDEAPGTSSGNEYSQLLVEQRLAQTYVELLTTFSVMEETAARLELPYTAEQLSRLVSVSAPPETQILVIRAEDTSPARAAEIANTIGKVFIEQNQERENLRYAEPIANWENRVTELGDEIERLEIAIGDKGIPDNTEDQAAKSRLETQLNESKIQYTEAFNNLNELQLNQAKESSNLVPVEAAQPPKLPVRPRTATNTLLALIAGGLLAIGIIFLIEYLDDTIKNQEQILEDSGLTTLGAIAQIKSSDSNDILITSRRPRDPISEAYRVLRTNLNFSAVDGELKSIVITSASPGEGKSTTIGNLGVVIAQTGKRVVIIDADLRRPVQHKIFQLPNNQGLTTAILDSETPVTNHLQETNITGLRLLTSGPIPPNPAELLNSQRMSQVIEGLKNDADILLFDSPPVLTVTDASILATQVDGSLLVVHAGKTRRQTFDAAVERLKKTNKSIFGTVLNRLNPSHNGGYYYYQYYDNSMSKKRKKQAGNGRFRLPGWISGTGKGS